MKKVLTLASLLFTSVFFTACGDNGNDNIDSGSYYEQHDYGNGNSDRYDNNVTDNRHDNNRNDNFSNDVSDGVSDVKDGIRDAVDGVEDAGENIITDVSSAVSDMVDNDTETTYTTAE